MEKIEDKIYRLALEEHPEFEKIPELDIKQVIKTAVSEIEELEKMALRAEEVKGETLALWVFSGPGTYDDAFINDRYGDYSWTKGMDRARIAYAERLVHHIAEIAENYPTIIYNGSNLQNSVLRKVVKRKEIKIPSEKIMIVGENINNTVDQIKTFILPKHLHKPGFEIGLVSHAPHLMRIIHTLNHYKTIPKNMTIRLFPISTPEEGKEEFAVSEIKGLLYYIFLAKNASSVAYPHIIHGKKFIH